ncbi:hypothetical protein QTP88_024341 [Uroleucon formosanum]
MGMRKGITHIYIMAIPPERHLYGYAIYERVRSNSRTQLFGSIRARDAYYGGAIILVRPAEFFCFAPHIIIPGRFHLPITRLIPCSYTHTHTHTHTPTLDYPNAHGLIGTHHHRMQLRYTLHPSRRDIYNM